MNLQGNVLVRGVLALIQDLFSGYRKRYLVYLAYHCRYATELMVETAAAPALDSLFVMPYLEVRSPNKISEAVIPEKLEIGRHAIWHFLQNEVWAGRNLVILAGPGYGKTTLSQYIALALTATRKEHRQDGVPHKLPVLLSLPDDVVPIIAGSPQQPPLAIPGELYQRLKNTLLRCGPFENDRELRSIFTDARINAWQPYVPNATNPMDRVESTIAMFCEHTLDTYSVPGLVSLLNVLIDELHLNNDCRDKLKDLLPPVTAALETPPAVQSVSLSQPPVPGSSNHTLPHVIRHSLTTRDGPEAPPGWLDRRLKRGKCVVLLDGLDEILDIEARDVALAWLQRQMIHFPHNRFVLTTRPHGYQQVQLPASVVLSILPFDMAQVSDLIYKWYRVQEHPTTSPETTEPSSKTEALAADLYMRIRQSAALFKLARNPLLLTMMANVHYYRGSLPERRVKLYAEIFDVLLSKRPIPTGMGVSHKLQTLQALAYTMMADRKIEITEEEASTIVSDSLQSLHIALSGDKFLHAIKDGSGLLHWQGELHAYRFAHFSLQEYLAAAQANTANLADALAAHVADEWWHETLRLYSALADATPLIRACLEGQELSQTFKLALECLQEAHTVQPEIVADIEKIIRQCVTNPEWLSIVSNTLSHIRQERMVALTEDKAIDTDLITHAEYHLFLHDPLAAENSHQPLHWQDRQFPPYTAKLPVVGIQPQDAQAFCEWLNQQSQVDQQPWRYRLPSAEELGSGLSIPTKDVGYWITTSEGFRCWGYKGEFIDRATIKNYFRMDVQAAEHDNASHTLFPHPKLVSLQKTWGILNELSLKNASFEQVFTKAVEFLQSAQKLVHLISHILGQLPDEFESRGWEYAHEITRLEQNLAECEEKRRQIESLRSTRKTEEAAEHMDIDQHYDGEIAKGNDLIAELEQEHSKYKASEQTQHSECDSYYDEQIAIGQTQIAEHMSQSDEPDQSFIGHYNSEIARMEQARSACHADVSSRFQSVYDKIDQAISDYCSQIADLESRRNVEHEKISTNYQRGYDQIDQNLTPVLADIERLRILHDDYETQRRQKFSLATTLRHFLNDTPQHMQEIGAALVQINAETQDYFSDLSGPVAQVVQSVNESLELSQRVLEIVRNHCIYRDAEMHHLKSFVTEVTQLSEHIQTMAGRIRQNAQLEHALFTACEQVHSLLLDDLPKLSLKCPPRLSISLTIAYDFIRFRSRETNTNSRLDTKQQRLRYLRVSALAMGVTLLKQPVENAELCGQAQFYFNLYAKFCALQARLLNEMRAFEGIRVVKEHVGKEVVQPSDSKAGHTIDPA